MSIANIGELIRVIITGETDLLHRGEVAMVFPYIFEKAIKKSSDVDGIAADEWKVKWAMHPNVRAIQYHPSSTVSFFLRSFSFRISPGC